LAPTEINPAATRSAASSNSLQLQTLHRCGPWRFRAAIRCPQRRTAASMRAPKERCLCQSRCASMPPRRLSEAKVLVILTGPQQPKPLFAVSDATGRTAETVLRSALVQFGDQLVDLRTLGGVRNEWHLKSVFRLARLRNAMVAFTFVNTDLNAAAHEFSEEFDVPCYDVLGSLLLRMSGFFGTDPRGIPGHLIGDDYFQRVEALEWSVKHDDGAEPHHLHRADIVLVGVSRTSKTPLSAYLAQRSWKVANVPLVEGIAPPPQLEEIDQDRIFALTIQPEILHEIRASRMRSLGVDKTTNYGHMDHIIGELDSALDLFRRNPRWPVIDVSHKAIEETAAIIEGVLLQRRRRRAPRSS